MCVQVLSCTYTYPPPHPPIHHLSPPRSSHYATRFIAKQPCERVHMLCPVPVLHPDNYCYIYHSK